MEFLIKVMFRSCECECEEEIFGSEKAMCETRSTTFWDSKLENVFLNVINSTNQLSGKTCQCRSKSVAPRETDAMMSNCLDEFPMMSYSRSRCQNILFYKEKTF